MRNEPITLTIKALAPESWEVSAVVAGTIRRVTYQSWTEEQARALFVEECVAPGERSRILTALDKWIRQRPGLDFANYGDVSAYRSESRSITQDLNHARRLLAAVEANQTITALDLREAFTSAFMGRLEWDGQTLSYTTGQYWPTEYRRAACAVLAYALWEDMRRDLMDRYKGKEGLGDAIRRNFRLKFGHHLARRWFN